MSSSGVTDAGLACWLQCNREISTAGFAHAISQGRHTVDCDELAARVLAVEMVGPRTLVVAACATLGF